MFTLSFWFNTIQYPAARAQLAGPSAPIPTPDGAINPTVGK